MLRCVNNLTDIDLYSYNKYLVVNLYLNRFLKFKHEIGFITYFAVIPSTNICTFMAITTY